METKALFGSCFLGHNFLFFIFYYYYFFLLFGILSPLDIDQKILCE